MSKQVQLRRGTTDQHASFVGADGEVSVDTTKKTVVVHDGKTPGGKPLASEAALAEVNTQLNRTATQLSTLPVIPNLFIIADHLGGWGGKEDERKVELRYEGVDVYFGCYAKMKPQGTSSLLYPKLNYTLNLYTNNTYSTKYKQMIRPEWGTQNKYVIKADWVDPTHSCNIVSAKIAAEMQAEYGIFLNTPHNGTVDGFPINVYFNDEFYGLYNFNIPKEAWLFGMDTSNENHIIACAEVQDGAGAFLSAADSTSWSIEVGDETIGLAKLNRLISFVKDSTDAEFVSEFDGYLNLDSCLNYYCFAYLGIATDNLAKNMLLATYDGNVWYPSLYDLDSLWGVNFDGVTPLSNYRLCPEEYNCPNSKLWAKIVRCYPSQLAARFKELSKTSLHPAHIMARFTEYINRIPPAFYAADATRWPGITSLIRTLSGMRTTIARRFPYTRYMLGNLNPEADPDVGRVLYTLPAPFVGDGVSAYVDSGIRLFDNPYREWTVIARIANAVSNGDKVYFSCFSEQYPTPGYGGLLIRQNGADPTKMDIIIADNYQVEKNYGTSDYTTVAIVKIHNRYILFVDGVRLPNLLIELNFHAYPGNLLIGCQDSSTFEKFRFSGTTTTSLKVYDRALSDAQIAEVCSELT